MVWSIIIIILSAGDQLLKWIINQNLTGQDRIAVLDGFFYIINRKNTGAAWSFLADRDWGIYVLAGISAMVTVILLIILFRTKNRKLKGCLALLSAGSIGNLIDRIIFREVTDYLDFHFGAYIFPTFNFADMMVVCGTILLCLLLFFDQSLLEKALGPTGKQIETTRPVKGKTE